MNDTHQEAKAVMNTVVNRQVRDMFSNPQFSPNQKMFRFFGYWCFMAGFNEAVAQVSNGDS